MTLLLEIMLQRPFPALMAGVGNQQIKSAGLCSFLDFICQILTHIPGIVKQVQHPHFATAEKLFYDYL